MRCKANKGAAGVDGQSFEDIDKYGERQWLEELAKELREKTYQASPVKRVWIPKADGKQRPLGIPTIRDRVVQMAVVLVLEPIFEADLQPEQHAYRLVREPDAGNPPVRFDEREVETRLAKRHRKPVTRKGQQPLRAFLPNSRATSRLY